MKKVSRIKFISSLFLIMILAFSGGMKAVAQEEDLKTATFCSFVVPTDFVAGTEKGMFINKNYPMESSSIKFSFYDNEKDKVLTNREKAKALALGEMEIIDESLNLTKDIYQETMSAAYDNEYQQNVGFKVEAFEKIKIDGYPGFKIVSSYQASEEEVVHQTVYMLISKYRMFTITYQRAEDDDCQEQFDNSAATIHLG